jgi:DNA-binding NarL/FixJ family response regulator
MIKVLLVDDQSAVRQGLRLGLALEPDLEVVGEAGNPGEALVLAEAFFPDVIVMDVEMPGVDGIKAIQRLRERVPASPVVVLTLHDDEDTRAQAQEAGAAAFVAKQGGVEGLLQAIRQLAQTPPEPSPGATGRVESLRPSRGDSQPAPRPLATRRLSVAWSREHPAERHV